MMMMNIYDEADLMTVLSRLSSRYLTLLKASASGSKEQLELSGNRKFLLSAMGSSSE
jgi:hypothetical protein